MRRYKVFLACVLCLLVIYPTQAALFGEPSAGAPAGGDSNEGKPSKGPAPVPDNKKVGSSKDVTEDDVVVPDDDGDKGNEGQGNAKEDTPDEEASDDDETSLAPAITEHNNKPEMNQEDGKKRGGPVDEKKKLDNEIRMVRKDLMKNKKIPKEREQYEGQHKQPDGLDHMVRCQGEKMVLKCTGGKVVKVLSGFFGRMSSAICKHPSMDNVGCKSDVTKKVRAHCDNEVQCSFEITDTDLGDPCPGTHKYLDVAFKCVEKPKRRMFCENEQVNHKVKTILTCPETQVIELSRAIWGRQDASTCPTQDLRKMSNTNCELDVKENLARDCDYTQSCEFVANANRFTDPCPGTRKYLTVDYRCIPAPHKLIACQGTKASPNCPKGKMVDVVRAVYGRSDKTVCTHPMQGSTDCRADVTGKAASLCYKERGCHIMVNDKTFSNICPGAYKYLELHYNCRDIPKVPSDSKKDPAGIAATIDAAVKAQEEKKKKEEDKIDQGLDDADKMAYLDLKPNPGVHGDGVNKGERKDPADDGNRYGAQGLGNKPGDKIGNGLGESTKVDPPKPDDDGDAGAGLLGSAGSGLSGGSGGSAGSGPSGPSGLSGPSGPEDDDSPLDAGDDMLQMLPSGPTGVYSSPAPTPAAKPKQKNDSLDTNGQCEERARSDAMKRGDKPKAVSRGPKKSSTSPLKGNPSGAPSGPAGFSPSGPASAPPKEDKIRSLSHRKGPKSLGGLVGA